MNKPKWLVLFALLPLMISFLVMDDEMPILPWAHQLLEIGIVLLVFGLMSLWIHSNRSALMNEEMTNNRWIDSSGPTGHTPLKAESLQPHFSVDSGSLDRQDLELTPNKGRYN